MLTGAYLPTLKPRNAAHPVSFDSAPNPLLSVQISRLPARNRGVAGIWYVNYTAPENHRFLFLALPRSLCSHLQGSDCIVYLVPCCATYCIPCCITCCTPCCFPCCMPCGTACCIPCRIPSCIPCRYPCCIHCCIPCFLLPCPLLHDLLDPLLIPCCMPCRIPCSVCRTVQHAPALRSTSCRGFDACRPFQWNQCASAQHKTSSEQAIITIASTVKLKMHTL